MKSFSVLLNRVFLNVILGIILSPVSNGWGQEEPDSLTIAVRDELLLAEDFQKYATYSKSPQPVQPGWRIFANHAEWERTSEGVKSIWKSGHMPVLKLEGSFGDSVIEVDFRYMEEVGKWGGCRISAANSQLNPRTYAVSVWANQNNDARARGLVLEYDEWKPGFITTVDRKASKFEPDTWYTLRLEIVGNAATASCNAVSVQGSHEKYAIPKTSISLGVGTCPHELRHLRVYSAKIKH